MKFYGDYHTHSNYSDGRQTIHEIINSAESRGLQEVAITDHGPSVAVIGIKNSASYLQLREQIDDLNENDNNIKVLLGAEANIRDLNGTLDIPISVIEHLDLLITGIHPYTMPTSIDDGIKLWAQNSLRHLGKGQRAKAINANTKASVEALYNNPQVDILAHPGLFFQVDVEEVARACITNKVLFEINCGHEYPEFSDIIKAYEIGVDFIVNSDAHFKDTVGQLSYGQQVIEKLEIEPERVVNFQGTGVSQDGRKKNGITCSDHYRFIGSRKDTGSKLS